MVLLLSNFKEFAL